MPASASPLHGLLFDKDGTLFGFQATWGAWAADLIAGLAGPDERLAADLATNLRFDAGTGAFLPDSPVIAGTVDDAVALIAPLLPDWTSHALRAHLVEESLSVRPAEAVPLAPLLARLADAGLALGVATNDEEAAARAQLAGIGLEGAFSFIAGADSGHGAKPGPGQCTAFAAETGLDPAAVAMVGDSTHDLQAGRAAGMRCVAVLTGVAEHADLAPFADVVLPDIGHLPAWLGL